MENHSAADSIDESQVFIQNIDTTDPENSECCYEGLTNSTVEDNLGNERLEVLYTLGLPTSLETRNSNTIDLIFTKSVHDSPDIYLSVSSFLL